MAEGNWPPPVHMTPTLEKKIASVLLALEARSANDADVQQVLDDPEVAEWMTACRNKGYGDANIFTMGRAY
jgi:hypothetical protein